MEDSIYYIEAEIAGKWHLVTEARGEAALQKALACWATLGYATNFWGW